MFRCCMSLNNYSTLRFFVAVVVTRIVAARGQCSAFEIVEAFQEELETERVHTRLQAGRQAD